VFSRKIGCFGEYITNFYNVLHLLQKYGKFTIPVMVNVTQTFESPIEKYFKAFDFGVG